MQLKSLEINGFKSFAKKAELIFNHSITSIVGPNGSGKSNVAESFRFVLGEQSIKSLRGKKGEDLIFNGGKDSARANRASAKLVFDNSNKIFNIDFDEVAIERVVHRDGVNEYFINGSPVRLRDITEMLASANIGASGHHIISQGEADRLLSASSKERKEMIEDALGLKVYQYKKEESEKKLAKTAEHIKEVEIMRRELAPQLKFLKRQVEKIEKALELRTDLVGQYKLYFAHESAYLASEKTRIAESRKGPEEELTKLEADLAGYRSTLAKASGENTGSKTNELLSLENKLRDARGEKDKLMREIGRLEGEVSYLGKIIEKKKKEASETNTKQIYFKEVEHAIGTTSRRLQDLSSSEDISYIKTGLGEVLGSLTQFIETHSAHGDVNTTEEEQEIVRVTARIKEIENSITSVGELEQKLDKQYAEIKIEIEKEKDKNVEAEKAILTIMSRQNELRGQISRLNSERERVQLEEADYNRELEEGAMLVGRIALDFTPINNQAEIDPRQIQSDRRRAIEKVKIRLEEMGGAGGEEVMREYKETEERDMFLMRELEDLIQSSESLRALIDDMVQKLGVLFSEGIQKINKEFNTFFSLMFGGGGASLDLVKEEKKRRKKITDFDDDNGDTMDEAGSGDGTDAPEMQEGIEIQVSLPHKKTKGLIMLSGGERALTSIALLFAMSQVNPPPFIILDETDAALDEANSKRYGDMIESLSKHSQLILITHNRETMSRAGVIYGVTMGKEGYSKTLSIAFDDALAVAK